MLYDTHKTGYVFNHLFEEECKTVNQFGVIMMEDVLDYNLKLVICGTAVSNYSAKVEEYYAGRGNKFSLLYTT